MGRVEWGDPVQGCLFEGEVGFLWRSQVLELSELLLREVIMGAVGELVRVVLAAAVVGGVVGPVSAAGALPGDSDADVDAEQSGEQSGGAVSYTHLRAHE